MLHKIKFVKRPLTNPRVGYGGFRDALQLTATNGKAVLVTRKRNYLGGEYQAMRKNHLRLVTVSRNGRLYAWCEPLAKRKNGARS